MNQKENSDSKALKAGIGYTIGNILIKGINFLSIPLFSRLMTTEEFGVYNVFLSYDAILFVVIGMALHSSVKSAKYQFKGQINKFISSISLIYLINLCVFTALLFVFRHKSTEITGYSLIVLLCLLLFSTGSALITLYNEFVSLEYDYKKYMGVALANSCGNVIISLILILTVFRQSKDTGRIVGATTTIVFLSAFILYSFYKTERPKYNRDYWSFGIRYSLPIIPHGVSQVLLGQFDRIMIQQIVSNTAAGIYSLAGNIKLVLTIINSSIATAWTTWFYENIAQNQSGKIQIRSAELVRLFSVFTVGILSIGPELILILGGSAYYDARQLVFPMVMDAFILFLYNLIVPSEYYKQKTKYIMMGTLIAAVINVVTNYIFIHKYGFVAAAYTTLFSYLCYLILHIVISWKLVGFNVVPLKVIIIYSVIVALYGAVDTILSERIIVRYILCMTYVVPVIFPFAKRFLKSRKS